MIKFFSCISLCICLFYQNVYASETTAEQSAGVTHVDYSSLQKDISDLIEKKMNKNSTVGLSIAVVDGQTVVWAEGFGWADKKNRIKATPKTVYRVGSITKLFTFTAAMQLTEQGKLDIDQPLQKALPRFIINSRFGSTEKITPRNIMTHHSGLPSDYTQGMWTEEPEGFTQLVDALKDEYTAYPPDTIFCYSNIGATLLGHAVQEISGQPYSELIEQQLLTPLDMSDSYIAATLTNNGHSSKGYADNQEFRAIPLRDLPAGGLNSTVLDLANFAKMIFAGGRFGGHQLLHKETLNTMLQFHDGQAPFDLGEQIGLGWFLTKSKNGSGLKAFHGGTTFLFNSMLTTLPDHQLAVIVLANSESSGGIVDEIANEALQLALKTKTGIKSPADKERSTTELPTPPQDLLTFPGRYSTGDGMVEIVRDDDRLQLISDDDTLNLVLYQDGQYHLQYKLLGLFTLDLEGLDELGITHAIINERKVLIAEYHGQKFFFGEQLIPHPIPPVWKSRTGQYEILQPLPGIYFTDVTLSIEDDFLVLRYTAKLPYEQEGEEESRVTLQVIDDRNVVVFGLGSGIGDTIRMVDKNGEEQLSWSGVLFRKVQ